MSLTTTSLRRGRRVAAGSLIAVAALALTACQDGTSGSASRASSPTTSSSAGENHAAEPSADKTADRTKPSEDPAKSDAPATGAKPTADRTSPNSAGSPQENGGAMTVANRCTADDMSLRLGASDVGAGNIRVPLVFTNKSKESCTLRGYPGVSLIARDGSTVGKPATREGATGKPVTLRPGQSAHALLHTLNDGVKDTPCWTGAQIVYVYPPGSKESMTTRTGGFRVCGGRFSVTAVESGSLG